MGPEDIVILGVFVLVTIRALVWAIQDWRS